MALEVVEMEWDGEDVKSAMSAAFERMEAEDRIPGVVYATPPMVKRIVLAMPDDVEFDYIPEGIGRLGTAYLKYRNLPTDAEMRVSSYDGDMVIRICASEL